MGKDGQLTPEQLHEAALQLEKGVPTAARLAGMVPQIYAQLLWDRQDPGLHSFWGLAANEDELAGKEIVAPAILSVLAEIADVPLDQVGVPAGLQHTYGYLLSSLLTEYGYKRNRWFLDSIDDLFGFPHAVVCAEPEHGTLLGNVTSLLLRIILRDEPELSHEVLQIRTTADPLIQRISIQNMHLTRIVESARVRDKHGRFCQLRCITDLVPFPAGGAWLIYAIQQPATDQLPKLITAFPVSQSTYDTMRTGPEILDPAMVKPRYNAVFPGSQEWPVFGSRIRIESTPGKPTPAPN
ncbi:MAG: hypothetical protein R3B84_14535 [Zavarzinella sp.]